MSSIANIAPATLTVAGMGAVMNGIQDLSEGALRKGATELVVGATAANIGSSWLGAPHALVVKSALVSGSCIAALKGAKRIIRGFKERNLSQILRGTLQTAGGAAAAIGMDALPLKVIVIAQQVSAAGTLSLSVSVIGAKDLAKGNIKRGACELLLGAGGLASCGYYVYSLFANDPVQQQMLPAELEAFMQTHDSEIQTMQKTHLQTGQFTCLGAGVSKAAYAHPDTRYVIKIPHQAKSIWGPGDSDVLRHFRGMQEARQLIQANDWRHLRIHEVYLHHSSQGPYLVEEMLEFENVIDAPNTLNQTVAIDQFQQFKEKGGYCDMSLFANHNVGISKGTLDDPIIVPFDFDCRKNTSEIENKTPMSAACHSVIIACAKGYAKAKKGPGMEKVVVGTAIAGAVVGIASYAAGVSLAGKVGIVAVGGAGGIAALALLGGGAFVYSGGAFVYNRFRECRSRQKMNDAVDLTAPSIKSKDD